MLNPRERPVLRQFLNWADVDLPLTGGMTLTVDGGRLETLDTPGHSPGHVALYEPASRTIIAGDLVAGQGTVGIFPPHGKMLDYFASLERARRLDARVVIPGHGPTLTQPPDIFARYIEHRAAREREVYAAVARGPATIEALIPGLYPEVSPSSGGRRPRQSSPTWKSCGRRAASPPTPTTHSSPAGASANRGYR